MKTAYQGLIDRVDEMAARLSTRYATHLACRPGCSACCHHHLSVFCVEGDSIREAIGALPEAVRERIEQQAREVGDRESRGQAVACPMLVDEMCAIYASRPLICRTQGLPLLLEAEDGEPEVDFCPLNFTAPDALADLEEEFLVPLEEINLDLVLVNQAHCREKRIEPAPAGERVTMSDLILSSPERIS